MSERRKPQVTFTGLAPGELPSVIVTIPIPVDDTDKDLVESMLKALFGSAPIAPLTTRGG